jgi:hypothetical protein
MKYILIGGAQSVGKTGTIYRLAKYFLNCKGFIDVLPSVPKTQRDFTAILDGKDKNGEKIRIAVNSATDTPDIIQSFKELLDRNKDISMVISSIRDDNFYPRKEFFHIIGITEDDIDFELPLAKITRKGKNRNMALKWYKKTIDIFLKKLFEERYLEFKEEMTPCRPWHGAS